MPRCFLRILKRLVGGEVVNLPYFEMQNLSLSNLKWKYNAVLRIVL